MMESDEAFADRMTKQDPRVVEYDPISREVLTTARDQYGRCVRVKIEDLREWIANRNA